MVIFNEETHTYTNSNTGSVYKSVTTLLSEYKKSFDSQLHAERVARREGVSVDFVLEMWKETTKQATDKGTKIHKIMEEFVKNSTIDDRLIHLSDSYTEIVKNNIGKHSCILSEQLLFQHDFEIAGTADLIFDSNDSFFIGDFKTNKQFRFKSDFNEFFKDPISHLSYCEFNSYALQLSLYAYMYELQTNKICKGLVIFYLQKNKWIPYHVNYLKSDVINILNHYKYNRESV